MANGVGNFMERHCRGIRNLWLKMGRGEISSMMQSVNKWFVILSGRFAMLVVLVGCAGAAGFRSELDVDWVIRDNSQAESEVEWQESPHHPQRFFAQFAEELERNKKRLSDVNELRQKICNKLVGLLDWQLTIFESQIFDPEIENLELPCLSELRSKIYAFYQRKNPFWLEELGLKLSVEERKISVLQTAMVTDGGLGDKEIILTFDDGPHNFVTPQIVDHLDRFGVKALFFVIGQNAKRFPQLLKAVAQKGHGIGNHSFSHPCMGSPAACRSLKSVPFAQGQKQMSEAHQTIFQIIGFVDPFFRFPYGASTPDLRDWARQNRLTIFHWSIDPQDWRAGQTADDLFIRTWGLIQAQRKGVLLLHDIHLRTAMMLPMLLKKLAEEGYKVVIFSPKELELRRLHPLLPAPLP